MSAIIGIAALGSFTFHYVLLIHGNYRYTIAATAFTFHYVSINTSETVPR